MSKKFLLIILLGLSIGSLNTIYGQEVARASFITDPDINRTDLSITFDTDLAFDANDEIQFQSPAELKVTDEAGTETPLVIESIEPRGGSRRTLVIKFRMHPALKTAKTYTITIRGLVFKVNGNNTPTNINHSDPVRTNPEDLELKRKAQKAAYEAAKPTENKTFFGGFNFASSGKEKSEGNAELNTNLQIKGLPNFFVTLNLKKSSKEDADPKQFNLGLSYRYANTFFKNNSNNDVVALRQLQRKRTLLGYFHEFTGRIEGEAMNFNTTNAVFDIMPFQILSRVKRIGTENLFMKFHIIPAGLELGRNLRTENESVRKYYVSRFKVGGELSFTYEPENSLIKRAEFDVRVVNRYLFRKETAFDQESGEATGISKGNKSYFQLDFKVYFAENSTGRFGFKVSRIRGQLPPTFNDTRAFTYGLIFESSEDREQ